MNSVIHQTFFISLKQMDDTTCNYMTSINTYSCPFIFCLTWAIRNSNVMNSRSKRIITPLCQPPCPLGTLDFWGPRCKHKTWQLQSTDHNLVLLLAQLCHSLGIASTDYKKIENFVLSTSSDFWWWAVSEEGHRQPMSFGSLNASPSFRYQM
jgi:hypothetical protein